MNKQDIRRVVEAEMPFTGTGRADQANHHLKVDQEVERRFQLQTVQQIKAPQVPAPRMVEDE